MMTGIYELQLSLKLRLPLLPPFPVLLDRVLTFLEPWLPHGDTVTDVRVWLSRAASHHERHSLAEEAEGKRSQDDTGRVKMSLGTSFFECLVLNHCAYCSSPEESFLIRRTLHTPSYEYSLRRKPIAITSTRNTFNLESLIIGVYKNTS